MTDLDLFGNKHGAANFIVTSGQLAGTGDSIAVNSLDNKILFFKNGKKIGESSISSSLEGH